MCLRHIQKNSLVTQPNKSLIACFSLKLVNKDNINQDPRFLKMSNAGIRPFNLKFIHCHYLNICSVRYFPQVIFGKLKSLFCDAINS